MISNKTVNSIIKLSLHPILDRLAQTAREKVVENFCLPHCGKPPDYERFCDAAEGVYRSLLSILMKDQGRLN